MRTFSLKHTVGLGFVLLAALAFPVSLQAVQLSLSWTDNSNNESGFKIERAIDGVTFAQVATVGTNVTSYSDTGLAAATTYWYRVRAYNSAGNSSYTNTVSATTATILGSNTAPTISSISDRTVSQGASTGSIGFTIGDAETAAGSLALNRSSSNTSLVPVSSIVLGGTGANRTVAVSPASNQTGSATITITVSDGSLSASETFVVTVTPVAGSGDTVIDADGAFHSSSLTASQTGSFGVVFSATPSVSGIDAVIGLSSGSASGYSDLAAIVRFNSSGTIEARNGASYAADTAISYTAGVTYAFRMQVDLSTHTYSIYVTAPGGTEQVVGSNFAFRTEQSGVASLDSWSARLSSAISGAVITVSGFDFTTTGSTARLINLSTRGMINGGEPMITGFVVSGTGTQRILIRAIGNTLADFGITNPVAAPVISIVRHSTGETLLETTGGWETGGNSAELVDAIGQTGAFQLQPGRGDAAVLVDLPPGLYSALVRDASGVGGTCLVEAYVVDDVATHKLINLSTRGFASTGGNVMIAGLVISGTESKRVLIRGVGPELNRLGVTNTMTDPQIAVFAQNVADPILVNDDWGDNGAASLVAATASGVGAFSFSAGSTDAALVADLAPGIYTVHLSPASGNAGTGLIEVYAVE